MGTLYKQELYKLSKKKSTWIISVLLVVQVIVFGLLSKLQPKYFPAKSMFYSNFAGSTWMVFFVIAAAATIITMEFQYGTIKELFYQKYSRESILISKWLTILTYSAFLYGLTTMTALISKVVFVSNEIKLTSRFSESQLVWQHWLLTIGASFITLWLMLSLVFLLATLFRNSAVAITIGILSYFAVGIIGVLMFGLIDKWQWMRWNPLNFMNFDQQLMAPKTFMEMTKLSDVEMFLGSLVYIILFLGIGLVLFRRKEA